MHDSPVETEVERREREFEDVPRDQRQMPNRLDIAPRHPCVERKRPEPRRRNGVHPLEQVRVGNPFPAELATSLLPPRPGRE
jgi:hypothetical protein